MGYRSQVAFTAVGKKADVLQVLLAYRLAGGKDEREALGACCYTEDGDDLAVTFAGDCIKWYEDYSDVQALINLYCVFKGDEQQRFHGGFARIGEDSDDVETNSFGENGWGVVDLRRSIDLEYPFDEELTLQKVVGGV